MRELILSLKRFCHRKYNLKKQSNYVFVVNLALFAPAFKKKALLAPLFWSDISVFMGAYLGSDVSDSSRTIEVCVLLKLEPFVLS
jgi:hypothetical protein